MFDDLDSTRKTVNEEQAFDLLQELERNKTDEIRRMRTHFRLAIKAGIILMPGNASDVLKPRVQGVTGDISEGGCSALFPIAAQVGDIYRLEFDRQALNIPLTFARCVRCRLIREDAFEAGFAFFKAITLPDNVEAAQRAAGV